MMRPRILALLLAGSLAACSPEDAALAGFALAREAPRYEPPPADTARTVTRRVWADSAGWEAALVAPTHDQRAIVLTDWQTGNLSVLGLGTGELVNLTENPVPYVPGFAMAPRLSRDGGRVSYSWFDNAAPELCQLRVLPLAGGEPVVIHAQQGTGYIQAFDWSPDGREILAVRLLGEGSEILVVSADGSGERVVRAFGWPGPWSPAFSADGRWIAYDRAPGEDAMQHDVYLVSADGSREVHLIDHPADDRLLGWAPDGRHLLVASDRTGTPAAWLFAVDDGRLDGAPLLVKPDLWQSTGVGFAPDGRFYYSVETGTRAVHHVNLDATSGRALGPPVPAGLRVIGGSAHASWSPDGNQIAFLGQLSGIAGTPATVTVRSLESGEARQFAIPPNINSPSALLWHPDGRSLLLQGGDRREEQPLVWRMDFQTGRFSPFFRPGGEDYLWAYDLSRDGGTLLSLVQDRRAGVSGDLERTLLATDLDTGQETVLARSGGGVGELQLRDPVLSHDGRSAAFVRWRMEGPEDLVTVPLSGGEPRLVASAQGIEDVVFDRDDSHLIFSAGDRQGDHALFRVPAAGGQPESLGLALPRLVELELHPGSGRLAFTAGFRETELWVMEGFLPGSPGGR